MICNYIAEENLLYVQFDAESEITATTKVDPRCSADLNAKGEVVGIEIIYPELRWPILELVTNLGPEFSLFQMLALEDLETKWQDLAKVLD